MADIQLKRASRNKSHSHVAYCNATDGVGVTSLDKDHSHTLTFVPAQEQMIDPLTGVVIQKSTDGYWKMESGVHDGHTHDLSELTFKEKKVRKTDEELVSAVHKLFKSALQYERDSRKRAQECEDFYHGKQWKETIKTELEGKDRCALTINKIQSKVNLLSGHQRQNRGDIRVLPVEDGDSFDADILTVLIKNINDQNTYEREESNVFISQCVSGRGVFHFFVDFDKNIEGDIVISKMNWKKIYIGQHEKEDLSDCEYLIKTEMFSFAKTKQLWPKKSNEITGKIPIAHNIEEVSEQEDPIIDNPGDQYATGTPITISGEPLIDNQKKQVRVFECWQKEYETVPVLSSPDDDFYLNARGMAERDVNAFRTIPGLTVIERKTYKMRKTEVAGSVMISDSYPELYQDDFDVIPVYAYKTDKDWYSWVEVAKDPQREINKRRSQTVDILNKVAAYGWFYTDDTFVTPSEESNFKNNSSSPGFAIKIKSMPDKPFKEEGVRFPSELVQMMQIDDQLLDRSLNMPPEIQGQPGRAESGIAILENKKQGLIGNEFLFDNLNLSKRKLFKNVIKLIQKIYPAERILRIIYNQNQQQPIELQGQPVGNIPVEEMLQKIQNFLDNSDITKYDIAISDSPWSPTTKRANFLIWSQMAERGVPVPPSLLVDLSDLPEKDRVKQTIEQMQQQALQQEQSKSQTEIQKSLIAAQSRAGGNGQNRIPQ